MTPFSAMSQGSTPVRPADLAHQMHDVMQWLSERSRNRRAPGKWDCCTLPGDWTIARGFADPMARWRGAYSTEEEAAEIITDAGGLLHLFECGYETIGIPHRIGETLPGDIGLLDIGGMEAGSIFTGQRWAFVGERGVGFASIDPEFVMAVWAVGCG